MLILAIWFGVNAVLILVSYKPDAFKDGITININMEIEDIIEQDENPEARITNSQVRERDH